VHASLRVGHETVSPAKLAESIEMLFECGRACIQGTTRIEIPDGKGNFGRFKTITKRVLTTFCLHINRKAHAACDLNHIVKDEGLLKVTGSHVHRRSDNISKTVLDRDVVTTGH